MSQFILFVRERVPLLPYVLFSLLVSLAPFFLLHININYIHALISFIGVFLLLIQMRLLDDVKDASTDKIAHKDRPFARGAISVNDGERMGGFLQLILLIFSALVFFLNSYEAFFFFIVAVIYIWNTYKGFYFDEWMHAHPITAFILGELVFFPIIFFCFGVADKAKAFDFVSLIYAFLLFSALLIYDFARKLDPKAHPILQNFVHLMGYRRVFFLLVPILLVSCIAAESMGLALILWPVQFAAFVALAMVLFSSLKWRFAAYVALLSLFIHAAAPILLYIYESVT